MRKIYVIVGASHRAMYMYAHQLSFTYTDVANLAGVCDPNPARAAYFIKEAAPQATYYADFDRMLAEVKPDTVIVTTVDRYHHEYIIKALDAGCDVITEKPMTIDDEKANAILEAERRNGKRIRVIFNMRFGPFVERIKRAVMEGDVGEVYHVNLEYLLDTKHGADYFRRWHRQLKNSGGLLVHKATHHFDLMNWFIDQTPDTVFAQGSRRFYGPTRGNRSERCLTCPHTATCGYAFDRTNEPEMQGLYFKAEHEDGYYRDGCVFSDEIDIMDTMSVTVRYAEGALLTYSLLAYSPYEGYRVTITGSKGRLEAQTLLSGLYADSPFSTVRFYNRRGEEQIYNIPKLSGTHGGSDDLLLPMLLSEQPEDPLHQLATSAAGIRSIMIGICANKSIADGKPHRITDYVQIPD